MPTKERGMKRSSVEKLMPPARPYGSRMLKSELDHLAQSGHLLETSVQDTRERMCWAALAQCGDRIMFFANAYAKQLNDHGRTSTEVEAVLIGMGDKLAECAAWFKRLGDAFPGAVGGSVRDECATSWAQTTEGCVRLGPGLQKVGQLGLPEAHRPGR